MARHIFRCESCHEFTMNNKCVCGGTTLPTRPARFSPEDKYGEYRRRAKEE